MERKFAKTCTYALLITILAAGVVATATNNSFALAQSCSAQLGSPNVYAQQYYYGGIFQVTLPVSATCSSYTGQLYATGTAYDNGANVGTANTILSPTYGSNGFTGQLSFTLPTSAQYNSVQFSVSIYSTQNGYGDSLLATTSSTFVLGSSYYPSYPYYPYYPYYPSYPSYPSYSSNPSYPSNPSHSSNPHYSGGSPHYSGGNPHSSGGNPHYSGGNPSYSGSSCYNNWNCYSNNNNNNNNNSHRSH